MLRMRLGKLGRSCYRNYGKPESMKFSTRVCLTANIAENAMNLSLAEDVRDACMD